jgi:hypothetical protein
MSSRCLSCASLLLSAGSVGVAWALSLATDNLYLPVVVNLGDELLSLLFLGVPLVASYALGRRWERSSPVSAGAAVLALSVTIALSWLVWIAWIVVECAAPGARCFD